MKKLIPIFCLLFFAFCLGKAQAFEFKNFYTISLDDVTAVKGYTIEAFDASFRFGITPNVIKSGGAFEFKELELASNPELIIPEGYKLISKIVEFDVKNKAAYDPAKPFWLRMKYESDLDSAKYLYYYDSGKGMWILLPSETDIANKIVKSAFHLPYAALAVLDSDVMINGKASWYKYKGCMCAASPDYPKGTKLLVTNNNKNESIVVTVNDWGPERDIHPDRVIDLDVVAFTKLASKGTGVLSDISVIPYNPEKFIPEVQALLKAGEPVVLEKIIQ